MRRVAHTTGFTAVIACVPATAYAMAGDGSDAVSVGIGVVMLVAAAVLLFAALLLERVSRGSAIAANISYVVAAAICLGAVALVRWVVRLVPAGLPAEQAALSSDVLTLVAITLFSVYFLRVRASLRRFIRIAEASDAELARAQAGAMPDEVDDDAVARVDDVPAEGGPDG